MEIPRKKAHATFSEKKHDSNEEEVA